MAMAALNKLCNNTIDVTENEFYNLVKQSEQLRILKNYTKLEDVHLKEDVLRLIKAMEAEQ